MDYVHKLLKAKEPFDAAIQKKDTWCSGVNVPTDVFCFVCQLLWNYG